MFVKYKYFFINIINIFELFINLIAIDIKNQFLFLFNSNFAVYKISYKMENHKIVDMKFNSG